jgi:hypothetical protein
MRTFLRELWELWYWSLFSPLKLEQRIQAWVPASTVIANRRVPPAEEEITETRFSDIMWWAVQPETKASRIRYQYLFLVVLSTLPLAAACLALGGLRDLILWLAITILCIGWGAVIPSTGLVMPWMSAWIYIWSPSVATAGMFKIAHKLPPVSLIGASLGVIVVILAITTWTVGALRQFFPKVATTALAIGEAGAIASGMAVIYHDEPFLIYLFGGIVLFAAWISTGIEEKGTTPEESRIHRMPLGMGVALAVGLGFALLAGPGDKTSAVVGILAIVLTTLSFILSFRVFLSATSAFCSEDLGRNLGRSLLSGLISGFVLPIIFGFFGAWGRCPIWVCVGLAYLAGFAVAPSRTSVRPLQFTIEVSQILVEKNWHGILNFPFLMIQVEELLWMQALSFALVTSIGLAAGNGYWALLCLPAVLLGYSRILPDWPLLALSTLLRLRRVNAATSVDVVAWLDDMPPHAYDIALLPIPGHSRLFASLFRKSPSIALNAILHGRTQPSSWAYERVLMQTWLRIEPFTADLPASERGALVRQSLAAMKSTEAIASFSNKPFPTVIFLNDFCINPETKGPWASNGDIEQLVPLFKAVSAKVASANEPKHSVEKERTLDAALADLSSMRTVIRDLGVDVEPWIGVVEHWERLIRISVEALGVALIQPFQAGGPLRLDRPQLFKGRKLLTNQLIREIAGSAGAPLILHGPRRCGKSSFLLHLSQLLPNGFLSVHVDLQSQANVASEGDFCYGIVRAAIRDLQGICPRVRQLPKLDRAAFQSSPYPVFEDWLDALFESLENNCLLICFDEFEKLGEAMERGKLSSALFDELRHLAQHRDRLRFIFCGAQTLEELGPRWTHYFINSKPIEILYLEPAEARELLVKPDEHFGLKYAPGLLDRIIDLTSCQPYLVQLLGEAMVKVAGRHGIRKIDDVFLNEAIPDAISAGEIYFADLWRETTGRNEEESASGQTLLCCLADGRDLPPLEGPTRAALRRLQRYHVVTKKDDGYRIEIPLVAQWIRERKVEDVLGGAVASRSLVI